MKILGLDISLSGTGACVLDDSDPINPAKTALFGTSSKQPKASQAIPEERWEMERFASALGRVKQFVAGADIAAIEDFAFGIAGAGARSNAGFGYLVRYWLYTSARIPFVLVGNASLKKFCVGKSSEKGADGKMHGTPKEVVIREVFNLWGQRIDNNNQADAFVLAKIAESLLLGYQPSERATAAVVKAQKDVLAELLKKNPWVAGMKAAA